MKGEVRKIGAWLFANLLIILGFVSKAKAKAHRGDYILSIYFHKPSAKEFEDCLKWLKKSNFNFISTTDIHNIIERKQAIPKGAVLITADDGWQTNTTNIADIAEKHGVPVTIFVSTDPVEQGNYWWSYVKEANKRRLFASSVEHLKKVPNETRLAFMETICKKITLPREAMTIEDVKSIATSSMITIGGHTLSHPILINCTNKHVFEELQVSRQKLQNWIGKKIDYFAYPNGDYSEREIQMLHEQGYKLAFSVHPRYLTLEELQYRFELPRFEVIEDAPFAETICRMVGVWEPMLLQIKYLISGNKKKERRPLLSVSGNRKVASALRQ